MSARPPGAEGKIDLTPFYPSENAADPSTLHDAYVRLHLFEGIEADKVSAMAEGLNRSKQVDDPSLQNLRGLYDDIRGAMQGKSGEEAIAYHQGENGTYYITEVVRAIMFFNKERFGERKHPNTLYRQQKKMVAMFEEDYTKSPSPIKLIVPHTHEILSLMDTLAAATPVAAKHSKFELGRMSVGKTRAGSAKNKDTPLHFLGKTMSNKVPNGWLMVMLAAFRANVDWDLEENRFGWTMPPEELIPIVINDLVRICVQEYRDNKSKPDEMARNAAVYEQCYDKVTLALHRHNG